MDNKISVIIPVYNTADVIQRTLDAIEAQTYSNWEMVIVNDGSTDHSAAFLDAYQAATPQVMVYHQSNQGVSAARNQGLALATGDFVCFLDSDDTYSPRFFELLLARQQQTQADVVYCKYRQVDVDGHAHVLRNPTIEGNILQSYFRDDGFFHVSCLLIRRAFLCDSGIKFEVGRKITEDVLFTVKLLTKTPFYCVDVPLFNYFYRPSSAINHKWSEETWQSDLDGHQVISDYITHHYTLPDKSAIIELVKVRYFERCLRYLNEKMMGFEYKKIKQFLSNTDFIDYGLNYHFYSRADRKKFSFIAKGSYFYLFIGTIYYRYLRINLKRKRI